MNSIDVNSNQIQNSNLERHEIKNNEYSTQSRHY